MDDPKKHEEALKKDLANYKKLDKINSSDEFDIFFKLQIDTVVQKMLACFTGTGPANWDEFCRIRGEVVGMLFPIQQVRGSKVLIKQMTENLNEYYNSEPK